MIFSEILVEKNEAIFNLTRNLGFTNSHFWSSLLIFFSLGCHWEKNFHTSLRDALIGATCKEIPGSVHLRRPATIYTPRDTRLQSGTTKGGARNFQQFWCKSTSKLLKRWSACWCEAKTCKFCFDSLIASTQFLSHFEKWWACNVRPGYTFVDSKARNCRCRDDTCKVRNCIWLRLSIEQNVLNVMGYVSVLKPEYFGYDSFSQ